MGMAINPISTFRLGVGIDGVLANTGASLCRVMNARFGTNIQSNKVGWELIKSFGDGAVDYFISKQDEIFSQAQPYEGARSVLYYIKSKGVPIFFISSRGHEHNRITRDWLKKNGLDLSRVTVLGVTNKASLARDLRLTHFIDDSPYQIPELAITVNCLKLVHEYNKSVNGEGIHSVRDWKDINLYFKKA